MVIFSPISATLTKFYTFGQATLEAASHPPEATSNQSPPGHDCTYGLKSKQFTYLLQSDGWGNSPSFCGQLMSE